MLNDSSNRPLGLKAHGIIIGNNKVYNEIQKLKVKKTQLERKISSTQNPKATVVMYLVESDASKSRKPLLKLLSTLKA